MPEKIFQGIGASEGIRIGRALVWAEAPAPDQQQEPAARSVSAEVKRLEEAEKAAGAEIGALLERMKDSVGKDKIGILKGQQSFLKDPAFGPKMREMIEKEQCPAEKAVSEVTEKYVTLFAGMPNAYLRERAADVREAGKRLLKLLTGRHAQDLSSLDEDVILLADELSPSDTIQLDRRHVLGFATMRGGKTSHTSIFANSMGIPAVVGAEGLCDEARQGDWVILDGTKGRCVVSPTPETLQSYRKAMEAEARRQELMHKYMRLPAKTKDGRLVTVAANIGSHADVIYTLQQGADAVGLFRTEQLYLSSSEMPGEEKQFAEYRQIAQAYEGREVIVRTLDIGGDKAISYLQIPKEDNPFLGYRAIRLCLNQKDIFTAQLRAILRASAYGNLAIMFPMISGCDELAEAKAVLEQVKEQLNRERIAFNQRIKVGIMIEIPSAAILADALAKEVDFFSIGTNDLVQYSLAADRGNEKVSYLYDYFNPAVLRLVSLVSKAAHANGIKVGMCGGMAGDPLAVPLLLGLELDELSMAAGSIPGVKYAVSQLDRTACKELAENALSITSVKEVRRVLNDFSAARADLQT